MEEKKIYDQRQYRLILKKIDFFLNDQISMDKVFWDIEDIIKFLNYKDKNFIKNFDNIWLDIDVAIYYLNEGHIKDEKLRVLDRKKIYKLMEKLKKLVESKIDKNLSEEDVEYKY